MKIHEYQGKLILKEFGVPVPDGGLATTVDEAVSVAKRLSTKVYVVKAQIHAGGRGKGGGVKLAKNIEEVREHASKILGMKLVTHQTGPEGQTVKKVWIEAGSEIARELYMSFLLDREISKITLLASTAGGMDIEEIAQTQPEKIIKIPIDPTIGIAAFQVRELAKKLELTGDAAKQLKSFVTSLYHAFTERDASLLEINPLVVTKSNTLIALDAKLNFDDNGLYRQKAVAELRDLDEEDSKEIEAKKFNLSYIALNGNIGCMVNGAGLAMATMDIIKYYGGSPANFLDVGGGATKENVMAAMRIILHDQHVKGIFINIFGGIVRCDLIATSVIEAAREISLKVPLVVRLAGTNVELGKKLLQESNLPIVSADTMADGAQKIVEAVKR